MVANGAERWVEPQFLDDANVWIDSRLTFVGSRITGRISRDHIQIWSTVWRVPTDHGYVYFKANHDALRHEAAVVAFLSARRPDLVPPPIAVDTERGWLLMADAGVRLRELVETKRSLDPWLRLLPLYADLQLDTMGASDELIALGAPDMRLEVLPARFDALLDELNGSDGVDGALVERARSRASDIQSMVDALSGYGIPEAIQHDDLNDGQVYFLDEQPVLLDWGDACISHPFFSLSVALEGVISWGVDDVENSVDIEPFRDAYLAPFADRLGTSLANLRSASSVAMRLGWACRAVNGHVFDDPEPTMRRLRMFMDGHV